MVWQLCDAKETKNTDNNSMKRLEIKKKIFNRGNKTEKIGLNVSKYMALGLKQMEHRTGDSPQEQILNVIEQYLIQCVEDKEIDAPVHEENSSIDLKEVSKTLSASKKPRAS